jgi:hypothetical protein
VLLVGQMTLPRSELQGDGTQVVAEQNAWDRRVSSSANPMKAGPGVHTEPTRTVAMICSTVCYHRPGEPGTDERVHPHRQLLTAGREG